VRDEAGEAVSGGNMEMQLLVVLLVSETGQYLQPPCRSTTSAATIFKTSSRRPAISPSQSSNERT
jgi:hypothetical protein